jgi:hypothetical protein
MNKRLLKRHTRQVSCAKAEVRRSQPDLRTPEEMTAAREASRPAGGRNGAQAHYNYPPVRGNARPGLGSVAKGEVQE